MMSEVKVDSMVLSMDFDNLKVIERWASQWMTLTSSADRCLLFIPHKEMDSLDGDQSYENFVTIERWARKIVTGECGCSCISDGMLPKKCVLVIPYKTALRDYEQGVTTLIQAQEYEFDNYKMIERWANKFASGECQCPCL